jgi:hypothetical protein
LDVAELAPEAARAGIDEARASAFRQRQQGLAALLAEETDEDKAFKDLVLGGVSEEAARQIIAHGRQVKAGTAESVENLDTQIRILDAALQQIRTSPTVQDLATATAAGSGVEANKVSFLISALGGENRQIRSAEDKQKAIDEMRSLIDAFERLRNSVPGAQPLLRQRNELTGKARQDAVEALR